MSNIQKMKVTRLTNQVHTPSSILGKTGLLGTAGAVVCFQTLQKRLAGHVYGGQT